MKLRILIFSVLLCCPVMLFAQGLDTAKIDNLTGLKGKLNEKERDREKQREEREKLQ